jgi:DNA-binding response OmpR family regulator
MADWKILIVDDEKDFVSTRMIAGNAPQVVGLEIMMSGMNGSDVLKRIKANYRISRSYF